MLVSSDKPPERLVCVEVQLQQQLVVSPSNLLEDVPQQLQPVLGLDVRDQCDQLGGAVRKGTIHWKVGGGLKRGRELGQLLNDVVQHVGDVGDDVPVRSLKVFLSKDMEVEGTRLHPIGEEGTANSSRGAAHLTRQPLLHLLRSHVLLRIVLQY